MLLATGQALGGVVEDAEEELKKLGKGQEQVVVSGSRSQSTGYPTRRSSTSTTRGRTTGSNSERTRGESTGQSGTESSAVSTGTATPETVMPNGRTKKDRADKQKGRLVSFGVVLLFALLIFLATAASRRLSRSE